MSDESQIPQHIGFIVDGNRRWAKEKGLSAYEGHLAGYKSLKEVALATLAAGVPYASAYVFSTENWKRSEEEVSKLMTLIVRAFKADLHVFIDNNIRLKIIGSREKLSDRVNKILDESERRTSSMTGGTFVVCLNYGGQAEIAPIDLVVRTSGEQRLSNFMLWRAAYSEFLFLDKFWPDMTKHDVASILEEYSRRSRRFGG